MTFNFYDFINYYYYFFLDYPTTTRLRVSALWFFVFSRVLNKYCQLLRKMQKKQKGVPDIGTLCNKKHLKIL